MEKTRTDLLNFLVEKHGLKRYLEIGVQNPDQNFNKIKCEYKVGVDPSLNTISQLYDDARSFIHGVTSDEFFSNVNTEGGYDLVFIDGLHHADQVKKDFENSLNVLSHNGFIVLHDCNPLKEEHTIVPRPTERGHWNGDVYKFAVQLASNWVNYKTVDIDNGCGVFYNCFPSHSLQPQPKNWEYLDKNRKQLLNLISWDELCIIWLG